MTTITREQIQEVVSTTVNSAGCVDVAEALMMEALRILDEAPGASLAAAKLSEAVDAVALVRRDY